MKLGTATSADAVAALPRGGSLRAYARSSVGVAAGTVVLLLALSAALRTGAIGSSFWIDEGLSVGIASHSLTDIPGLLRQDGSPPLYYLLLHEWMRVFGNGEAATHALSLLLALVTVPIALWAGWSLFGRRAGVICAALAAVNPLLSAYAQETRMYSLVAVLGLVAATAFAHVFAFRRRAYLALLVPAMAAMLYTHNWSAFYCVGAVAGVAPAVVAAADRRGVVVDAAIAFGGAGLLYLPWMPSLLFQAQHTGAPWASHPHVVALTHAFYFVVGNAQIGMALLLAGGAGIAAVARRGTRSPEIVAVTSLLTIAFVALIVAWVYSQVTLAWAPRYLTILIGPMLLVSALGLARGGRLGTVAAVIVIWLSIGLTGSFVKDNKSNVAKLAHRFEHRVQPGDLLISTQPEQVATLHYYLPAGLRYATPLGPVADPRVTDWRDAVDRLRASRRPVQLDPLIASMRPGQRVLLVSPVTRRHGWRSMWTRLVRHRSRQWQRAMASDGRLRRLKRYRPGHRSKFSTVQGFLYVRR